MKTNTKRSIDRIVTAVALFCTVMQPTYALTLSSEPLFLANRVPPKVMIALSKDQQLYKKAYNDYSDLDGDGVPETTYKHSVTYYGYFDPTKCYAYANNRFEPRSVTTYTVTVPNTSPAVTKPGSAYCDDSTGRWSGNFLNWVSMTRMDAVRKILYGGMRSTDTTTDTVLERAFVPTDAHSWAKFYNGPDISKLTPFTGTLSTPAVTNLRTTTNVTIDDVTQRTTFDFTTTVNTLASVGDQVKLQVQGKPDQYYIGWVDGVFTKSLRLRIDVAGVSGAGRSSNNWTLYNLSSVGITFCNTTPGEDNVTSQSNTSAPPLIRVAQGNFGLWNANERWQCLWSAEIQSTNGNQLSLSGIESSTFNPIQSKHGLGSGSAVSGGSRITTSPTGQYFARVQVCVDGLQGTENCRRYPNGKLKPVGLLQNYADTIDFGLITGSYEKNTSGGVLRKAVGSFSSEVVANTGVFSSAAVGIVETLDRMRIYGYNYNDGTYQGSAGDNCSFQLTDIPPNACTSWGNPMSEIFYETLRYFASTSNNQQTPAYTYTNSSPARDWKLGLPLASWTPPMNQTNACAKINVLAFNASVSSDDEDLANTVASSINTNKTVRELTNTVGDLEGITNGSYFIGKRAGDTLATPGFELCTAKTVTAFGDLSGICPEGPTVRGSYLLAGLAHQAKTNPIRKDLDGQGDPTALKVTSYGVQLATNTPQLEIPVPGKPGQKVVIQPIYRYDSGTAFGGGSLVDMKYVSLTNGPSQGTGKVYLNWEDSEQGGDYDQDMWGVLEWTITGTSITVTTNAIFQSTGGGQGFGYTISGTTADGPHFHSGINGFNFSDTVTATYADPNNAARTISVKGCSNCWQADATGTNQRGPTTVTYTLSSNAANVGSLKDPLWYLAKYGGFDDRNGNSKLDANEWDVQNNLTGDPTPDGVPDTYFLVTNPLGLESALERAFRGISQQGSGSAVASNSGSIKTGTAVYTARFRTAEWSGQFSAFRLAPDGSLLAEEWEASSKLPVADKRVVLTYRNDATGRRGVPFRWPADPANLVASDVGKDLVDALNARPDIAGTNDGRGDERLAYLRGDPSREGNALNSFRIRSSKLGDIVNSTPVFVPSVPNDVVLDPTYLDFQKPFLSTPRTPMVYVAANDGMLHGFDASVSSVSANGTVTPSTTGGVERLAYVPSKTFSTLNQLTSPTYVHHYYVDGSPTAADAKVKDQWKTVLVGALGAGGRGVYALDVTNPPVSPDVNASDSRSVESSSTAKVLWEFNVDDDDAPTSGKPFGLGYVLGQPLIRKMANGKWAAIVSGGYNSTETVPGKGAGDGQAYTYILFLDGPSKNGGKNWEEGVDYIRLPAPTAAGTINGMAPPFAADVNADGMVDFIYAGDLLGNFWKFDVSGAKPSLWSNSSNRVVLFAAGAGQPITAAATGIVHPTGKGFLLLFGTGKYLEPSDPLPPYTTQSFYAIWDKNDKPNNISGQTTVTSKSSLFKQVIATDGSFRYITQPDGVASKVPNWNANLGWYMDLPATGERSVFEPLVASRRLVFSTLVPSGGACDFGGTSYIMVVNPATGSEFDSPVIDIDRNGLLSTTDLVQGHFAAGIASSVGIAVTPKMLLGGVPPGQSAGSDTTLLFGDNTGRVAGAGNRRAALFICGARGQCAPPELLGAGRDSGRATWREVLTK